MTGGSSHRIGRPLLAFATRAVSEALRSLKDMPDDSNRQLLQYSE